MNTDTPPPDAVPTVHALVVCRDVSANKRGELSLTDVVEVVIADAIPGEIGPLVFVALVRGLPAGPGEASFLVRAMAPASEEQAPTAIRLPLKVNIPEGFADRQIAVQLRVAKIPVAQGGWFELGFHWQGQRLAWNRFAVGQMSAPAEKEATPESE